MKKLFSVLLVCALVISCLTGCTSTTKVKVSKTGKITGSTVMDITDGEFRSYCDLMSDEGTITDEAYAEAVASLIEEGYVKKTDSKGNVYYRMTAPLEDTEDMSEEITPTYCVIEVSDKDKEDMETYKDMGDALKVKLQVTFPYKVKKTNGKLSKDKKTVTWDLVKMQNKKLTAYTVKYKK